jgi:predicted ATPase/class 3 adenylate cyclase
MPDLATETVSLLFTDIEGSTRLWERDNAAMGRALGRHDAIVRASIEQHGGRIFGTAGDAFCAAFSTAPRALAAACDAQAALTAEPWAEPDSIKVRMAVHTGIAELRDGNYFGPPLNRVARLLAAGHGGQILLSLAAQQLVRDRLPDGVQLRDMGERRLKDLIRPERIYQVLARGLPSEFPALRTLDARAQNLPIQLTSFVGREREVDELKHLLGSSRLVTLIGAGGAGKTRLSVQVAADLVDNFNDGVWLVELAALTDARLVPQTVASVLGVKEQAGESIAQTLVGKTCEKELLLVLDNCEHLLQACAELSRTLLASCARVRILASSREPLRIDGETAYRVPSLHAPDARTAPRAESLIGYPAVRLFIDRARAVRPAFAIDAGNARAVAAICRNLDGIPLALELAAARLRAMSAEELNERLDKRFHVLTGGSSTALPRQQTLRALIDWSYDLLSADEKAVFRSLAAFVGGCTLRAAEEICSGGGVDEAAVMDHLFSLVDKSLVVAEERSGDTRYRMLETVRQYAVARLGDSSEHDAVQARHLAFYLKLAEEARPELTGPKQGEWLARLDLERENLLAAHAACDRAPEGAVQGLRLVPAIKMYWVSRGLMGLGRRLCVEALARPGAQARNADRCRVLFNAGQFESFMGQYAEARSHLEESLAIAGEIGEDNLAASSTTTLALATLGQGDRVAARRRFEEAIVQSQKAGNKRELSVSLNGLAQLERMEGALDTAEARYQQSLALVRELGDRETGAVVMLNLAIVAIGRGSNTRAREILRDALAIATEVQSRTTGQSALDVCAGLAALHADWRRAARFVGAFAAQAEETGYHRDPADEAFIGPIVARARTELGLDAFAAAEAEGRALSYDEAIDEAGAWLNGLP